MASTFKQKLAASKELAAQSDDINENIVEEFLTTATPVIQMLRDINESMSQTSSFAVRAAQVLHQIDVGLLKDPLSLRVVAKMKDAEAAKSAKTTSPKSQGS